MDGKSDKLLEYMLEISQEAAAELVQLRDANPKTRLIQAMKRDKSSRFSEQELRIACINAIQSPIIYNYGAYFSVETPTDKIYRQSGKGYRSAMSDLSLYHKTDSGFERIANIELKSKNCKDQCIYKDIEKLIKEGMPGAWFHLLDNADKKTYYSLFSKFIIAVYKVIQECIPKHPILFTFFDLKSGTMLARKVQAHELMQPEIVFSIDYNDLIKAKSSETVDGWMIFRW